jgi:hypothetical protein
MPHTGDVLVREVGSAVDDRDTLDQWLRDSVLSADDGEAVGMGAVPLRR